VVKKLKSASEGTRLPTGNIGGDVYQEDKGDSMEELNYV
jgi:hypothetical protein